MSSDPNTGWKRWRTLLIFPPIFLGAFVLFLALAWGKKAEPKPVIEIARTMTVVKVRRQEARPHVMGYGTAKPAKIWRAVAQVDGIIVETHHQLKAGALIEKDTVLVRIDPTDYQLEIDRLEAEIGTINAQIDELKQSKQNDQETLKVYQETLAIADKELERQRRLRKQNAASESDVEAAERDVLNQKQNVQQTENSLRLFPSKMNNLDASKSMANKKLEKAKRDLARTVIKAPFDCRLAKVTIEPGQYVAPNENLFEIYGVMNSEVEAQVPMDDMVKLVEDELELSGRLLEGMGEDGKLSLLKVGNRVHAYFGTLRATVRVRSGDWVRQWPAKIVRIREAVDPKTRTIGVVVSVDNRPVHDGPLRPPLLDNVFCEVEFEGQPQPNQLSIPQSSVRQGDVFVVNNQKPLERRKVKILFAVEDHLMVSGDLSEGESVVVSDPSPAVEGSLVDPIIKDDQSSAGMQPVDKIKSSKTDKSAKGASD